MSSTKPMITARIATAVHIPCLAKHTTSYHGAPRVPQNILKWRFPGFALSMQQVRGVPDRAGCQRWRQQASSKPVMGGRRPKAALHM